MTDLELRPIDRTEFPEFYRVLSEAFLQDPHDDDRESLGTVFEPERSLAAFDDGQIVSTAGIYTRCPAVRVRSPGSPWCRCSRPTGAGACSRR
jgi:GNAT acetyltransferase-like protein